MRHGNTVLSCGWERTAGRHDLQEAALDRTWTRGCSKLREMLNRAPEKGTKMTTVWLVLSLTTSELFSNVTETLATQDNYTFLSDLTQVKTQWACPCELVPSGESHPEEPLSQGSPAQRAAA